jgi:hypothetical protein
MNAVPQQIIFASAYKQLTPSERAFVDSVVAELDRAAQRTNERISTALYRPIPAEIAERSRGLLERPMVTAAITERINELAAMQELTIHRMVREMGAVAFSNMGDYMHVDGDGTPVFDLARCTPEQLAAIKTIKVKEHGDGITRPMRREFEITLHDKLQGMKMLAEYMGLLEPDNPHWRADVARAAPPTLPVGATVEQAGDAYAAMIGE